MLRSVFPGIKLDVCVCAEVRGLGNEMYMVGLDVTGRVSKQMLSSSSSLDQAYRVSASWLMYIPLGPGAELPEYRNVPPRPSDPPTNTTLLLHCLFSTIMIYNSFGNEMCCCFQRWKLNSGKGRGSLCTWLMPFFFWNSYSIQILSLLLHDPVTECN